MISYATFAEFTQVYSIQGVSETEISSYWLPKASLKLNERLGTFFTTPFSSNNETAKDLTIDIAFDSIQNRQRTRSQEVLRVKEDIETRIDKIIGMNSPMIDSDGKPIYSDAQQQGVWSTNENYSPTFNMLDAELQRVDRPLLDDTARDIQSRNGLD